ncbi:hypothetical protein K1T71_004204 [Dendrolimus kikuchii]|uniref:Uncharacterized protein n=1 Tax=Dendrolimus kikuchii TaxID=765133 RepID=A0ACC1DAE3_9NEOP|nr:hypothetical protein K1T71_004204 [Dendrolimus kikuchii]
MLSPQDDDCDDNHLCIKCNATIEGLDNYITHRKQRCRKIKNEPQKSDLPTIDPLEPSYSLGADVFFQSLELQSSVKKTSLSRLTPPIPISKANENKALVVASTSRELPTMSPLETNLRGEDWIGGHSLRIGSNIDNQTKLINAVASISGSVKKDLPMYQNFYEDSDESEVSEEDDDEEQTGSKWKPPANYTGGKWRPDSPEEWDLNEQEHAGGKWKPIIPETNDRDEDYDAPPPGHTKGKWVPGANEKAQIMQTTIQAKGSVHYWCGPCNRRLGSRAIYDKHLKSSLHLKKVLPEHELEFAGHLEHLKVEKRATRPSRFLNDSIYAQVKAKRQKTGKILNINIEKKKRKRKPNFIHCAGCNSRVRQHLMGKHLISHYHFRKATETSSAVYQQLILDNIEAIVHQSPFQCSPCKFYTNWLSNFMQHWFSDDHELKVSLYDGRHWCSFCKFECEESQDMLQHLSSSDHSEVVAVINRSMPIIIRKKTIFKCGSCFKEFRYNIEMKKHCEKTGHPLPFTGTDVYQELHNCQYCKTKFKSSLTLAAHLKSKHKQKAFLCLVCEKTFPSSEEAKKHRQTSEHRVRRKENSKEQGVPIKDMSKKCPYCIEKVIFRNILVLKDHIRSSHPDVKKKCPKCGMTFILAQEVTRHIRSNGCNFESNLNSSVFWSCSQCLFRTDSQAECFFHEILHTEPLTDSSGKKPIQKYSCPLCTKVFKKASLRQHLRQHTFERPYVCSTCGANFTRRSSLSNHNRREHAEVMIPKLNVEESLQAVLEWICGKCDEKFSSRSTLARHVSSSCVPPALMRRCPHEDCTYVATTTAQLARHRRSHGERIKLHQCPLCPFKSDQASHMKRHMICHKGIKPYACPYCSFTCGSLMFVNLAVSYIPGYT